MRKFSGDLRTELIKQNVPGKSFVDVGCMWGIHGHYCFEVEKHGASRSIGVDIYPPSDEFLEIKKNKIAIEQPVDTLTYTRTARLLFNERQNSSYKYSMSIISP